jgi:hypothetical protein
VRLTIGQKSLKEGKIEMKARSGGEVQLVALDQVVKAVKNLLEQLN